MLTHLSSRLSYANVMSTVAVFLALGGAAYAVVSLPKNSVGANQIKPNAVSSSKVKDRSLWRATLRQVSCRQAHGGA